MPQRFWLNSYPIGVSHTIEQNTFTSLPDMFDQEGAAFASKKAVSNFGSGLTYLELAELSSYFAAWLQNVMELKKGDRVAIMLPNIMQYYVAMMGILRAGLVVVNVNPLYTEDELYYQLNNAGPVAIIVLENFAYKVERILSTVSIRQVIVTKIGDLLGFAKSLAFNIVSKYIHKGIPSWHMPKAVSFKTVLAQGKKQALKKVPLTQEDIAFLQYTGGTTGVSKGVILTHGNILANVDQAFTWVKNSMLKEGKEVIVAPLPLYHIFSLTVSVFCFFRLGGETVLITNPKDIPGLVKTLAKTPYTVLVGIDTLLNGLLQNQAFNNLSFSKVKLVIAGGMALQKSVAEKWERITHVSVTQGYGLSEASPIVTINPLNQKGYNGSIGLPLPSTDVSLRDDENNEVPVGEVGELCVRGPQVMRGYWQNEAETRQVFTEDGWLKTGDIAKFDDRGFLYIVDRLKDLIIVSGFKVYPHEVESVISSHPQVKEVAVIGIPSDITGEAVRAFVVSKTPELKKEEIVDFCTEHLVRYKIPRSIVFVNELPKSNIGKVLRKVLRDSYLATPDK